MPFLIALHGRSGTLYTTEIFKGLGYAVKSEAWADDGIVSWQHVPIAQRWHLDPILHQVRDPLKTIGSTCTYTDWAFRRMFNVIGYPPAEKLLILRERAEARGLTPNLACRPNEAAHNCDPLRLLFKSMWGWYHWSQLASSISSWRYQIECFDEVYPEVFSRLGLPVPRVLPDVPKNINTRKTARAWREVSWEDLRGIDSELTDRIKELAVEYGYDACG